MANEFKIKNGLLVSGSITGVTESTSEDSAKMATTAWTRTYVSGLSYVTSSALTTALGNYLALSGGTLTGGLYINPANTAVTGLDVASNTITFRSDNLEGFKRQLTTTLSSGTLVKMQAAGYGGTYVTDLGFYTSSNSAVNTLPNIYLTGGNNYVGINNVAPAYNLDVTGTGRYTSVVTLGSTLSINGGVLAGNNIVSMRANPTGGQFRIEKSDGSLSAYPFYVGVDGTALAYYYNAAGALMILLHTNGTSYFGKNVGIGQTSYGAVTEMLEVNGYVKATGFKTGGTSAQFLKADGSVDSSVYLTTSSASTTYQTVLTNPITGTGTTNVIPKFTGASTLGNSNIQDSGTLITLGSNSYVNGALGIGSSTLTGFNLRVTKPLTGAITATSILNDSAVQSDVVTAYYYQSYGSIQNTAFTLTNLTHYYATGSSTFGSASLTNQYGFRVDSALTGATSNYGFYGNIASGTNRWNLYMAGTANNYLAGSLGIGTTGLTGWNLRMLKAITGTTQSYGMEIGSTINSDVTTQAVIYGTSITTEAATFTLTDLFHYTAFQNAFGAGSTVTTQIGFRVTSSLTGATNNFGFRGEIASGTGRWNLYMNGTANNYMAGSLGIGTTSLTGLSLAVVGLTRFTGTTASDTAPLGAELAAVTGTGTNWTLAGTDLSVGGYTHTIGSVVPLTTTLAAVSGTYYQIAYTITGRTAGSITISYGGTSTNTSATGTTGPLASSNAVLIIAPTTDFDGNIVLSIKSIGTSSSSFSLLNSSSIQNIDFRSSNIISNTFIGLGAGRRNTIGSNNTLLGNSAGNNNTTGGANTIIGQSAGSSNTIGSNNTFIGGVAGGSNSSSNFNTYIGYASGTNNTGQNNTFLGFSSGRYIADGVTAATILNQSILIGYNTRVLADNQTNQVVIGYNTTGLGSNTTVLGNSSTTLTALYGAVITGGTSINASAQLQVDSTTKGFLPPRMTAAQRTAIASPATGLIVYQTDGTEGLYIKTASAWRALAMI